MVFGQRTQLWWDLPLSESFTILKEIYNVSDEDYAERMKFLNQVLQLDAFFDRPVRTLSLGQRMRADLGAALLHNPKVLYLDEPTIGLDLVVKDNIRAAIKEINEKYKNKDEEIKIKPISISINEEKENIETKSEKIRISNFNLEMMNKYGVKLWEEYIIEMKMINSQLRKEKEKLKNEIILINKKRKYNQTNYLKELDKLDSKIKNERELIHNIEKELL